jgi:hypothetical protein
LLKEKLRAAGRTLGNEVAIQAEVIGPGIQKNKDALKGITLRVFSVLILDAYRLADYGVMPAILAELGIDLSRSLGGWR